jgi:hypothetical protein
LQETLSTVIFLRFIFLPFDFELSQDSRVEWQLLGEMSLNDPFGTNLIEFENNNNYKLTDFCYNGSRGCSQILERMLNFFGYFHIVKLGLIFKIMDDCPFAYITNFSSEGGVGRKTLGKERFSNPFSILSLKKISSVSDAPWNVEFIDKILTFQQLFCII